MVRNRLHSDFHRTGAGRWCAECRKWCNLMDWETEHIEHGDYRIDTDEYDEVNI